MAVTACLVAGAGPASTRTAPVAVTDARVSEAGHPSADARALHHRKRHTRFGTTVWPREGETVRQAFLRQGRTYGDLGVVRVFFPGLPASWSTIRSNVGQAPVVVSFRALPSAVVAGRYDNQLREWFANAPRDRVTRWTFWHEPEDDVAAGTINPEMYRRAWAHIKALADRADNRRLRATLTLMCWTFEPNSHRDWRDYYAGDKVIDVLAFDCYNAGARDGNYRPPQDLFGPASRLAHRIGKPWGVAELGSVVAAGDNGRGRAEWLRRSAAYLNDHGARFASYFDSDVGTDYRLHDYPSRDAWRDQVTGGSG